MKISDLQLLEIIDSRTNPTVQALINGESGKAPSGASTGEHEVNCSVPEHLEDIEESLKQRLEGREIAQEKFDEELKDFDGTEDFSRIGAASIAASFAFKNALGYDHGKEFPYPLSNVVGGGEHGGNTSIQEFLVVPVEAETFPEAVKTNAKIYQELKERYSRKIQGMNDEGALITSMDDEQTLKAVKKVADKHGARLGLDIAASEFYEDGEYKMPSMRKSFSSDEMLAFVQQLIDDFELIYVEDPFDQNDFRYHAKLAKQNPEIMICGDDLFTTSKDRLREGIDNGACNSLIVKPNQIGTVTDARETVELAKENDYTPIVSHRSGETCDHSISDLALEWNAPYIKAGISDIRVAKLNRLIELWNRLEDVKMASR